MVWMLQEAARNQAASCISVLQSLVTFWVKRELLDFQT